MYLYHGSNVEVITPKIIVSNRNLDFGVGFYITSSLEQKKYDIVIGPVANDNTMPVINDYMSGNISEETALAIFDMWENEIETGDPRNSLYLRGDEIE